MSNHKILEKLKAFQTGASLMVSSHDAAELAGRAHCDIVAAIESGELKAEKRTGSGRSWASFDDPRDNVTYRIDTADLRRWAAAKPLLVVKAGGQHITFEGSDALMLKELLDAGHEGLWLHDGSKRADDAGAVVARLKAVGVKALAADTPYPNCTRFILTGALSVVESSGLARKRDLQKGGARHG